MKKIALFASYNGSIFESLYNHIQNSDSSIELIITNNSDANVLSKAKQHNIDTHVVNNKTDENPTQKILDLLKQHKCNLIILAGYMKMIPKELTDNYTIINSHPALLPKYGGKGMYGRNVHTAVIDNKETISGVTIHYVNEVYDDGEIILQKSLELEKDETVESLERKIKTLEQYTMIEAINLV